MPAAPPPVAEPLPVVDAMPPAEEAPAEAAPAPLAIHLWGRIGSRLQNPAKPKKIDHFSLDGDMELHFDGNVTKEIGVTGNIAAVFPDGLRVDATDTMGGTTTGTPFFSDGHFAILDLIARFDIIDAFHIWAGRMLVPLRPRELQRRVVRSALVLPWLLSPHGFIGPREGHYGRNDGITVWGQAHGGLFKYYAGAFDLDNPASRCGRVAST